MWAPVLAVALLVGCVLTVLLVRIDGDASRLVRAAPPWTDPASALPSLTVLAHEYEFDGQFFYRLAVAPFSDAPSVAGVTFDIPALRGSRWGLGLAGFLASAGQAALVPWTLLAINSIALAALAFIGARFAQTSGRHAMWGVLLPLWPGFAYTLTLDTSELLASTLLCAGLLAARRQSFVWAAVWLSLAAITRETALVGGLALLGAGLWSRFRPVRDGAPPATRPANGAWIAGAVAVACFLASQLFIRGLFGQLPLAASADNNAGIPFAGLLSALLESIPPSTSGSALRLLSLLFVLGIIVVGACTIRSSTARLAEKLAWCGSAAFIVVLNGNPLVSAPSFMRAATELGLLTVILLFGSRSRLLVPTAVAIVVVGTASIGTMLLKVPPG